MASLASQCLHGDLSWAGPSTCGGRGARERTGKQLYTCLLSTFCTWPPVSSSAPCFLQRTRCLQLQVTHVRTNSQYQPSFSGGFLKCSFKAPGLGLFETQNWTTKSLSLCEGFEREHVVSMVHCLRSQQVNLTCQENTQDKILHSELFIFLKKTMFIHIFE